MTGHDNTTEIWKPIPSWFGIYEASSLGRIRRVKRSAGTRVGHILKQQTGAQHYGRLFVMLSVDSRAHAHKVHKLVAEAFLGPCPKGLEVNHLDGNHTNNRPENFEYVTREENMRHAKVNGLMNRGERVPSARLTEAQAKGIRLAQPHGHAAQFVAACLSISRSSVEDVVAGRTWKHI